MNEDRSTDNNSRRLSSLTPVLPRFPALLRWGLRLALGLGAFSAFAIAGLLVYVSVAEPNYSSTKGPDSYSYHIPIHLEFHTPSPLAIENNSEAKGDAGCSELITRAAVDRVTKGMADEPNLRGATASLTERNVLAAWSHNSIYLSVDDGRSFGSILNPPGKIFGVALGCGGVYALAKPNWLGHRDADGNESWRTLSFLPEVDEGLPADRSVQITVGKTRLAIAQVHRGDALISTTSDNGETWRFRRYGHAGAEYLQDLLLRESGVFVVLGLADCDWNGMKLLRTTKKGSLRVGEEISVGEYYGLGLNGDTYLNNYQCREPLCVLASKKNAKPRPVRGIPMADEFSKVIRNQNSAFIVADRSVYDLRKRRARLLSKELLPLDLSVEAADRRGRLLLVSKEGELLRWSSKLGTRTLL